MESRQEKAHKRVEEIVIKLSKLVGENMSSDRVLSYAQQLEEKVTSSVDLVDCVELIGSMVDDLEKTRKEDKGAGESSSAQATSRRLEMNLRVLTEYEQMMSRLQREIKEKVELLGEYRRMYTQVLEETITLEKTLLSKEQKPNPQKHREKERNSARHRLRRMVGAKEDKTLGSPDKTLRKDDASKSRTSGSERAKPKQTISYCKKSSPGFYKPPKAVPDQLGLTYTRSQKRLNRAVSIEEKLGTMNLNMTSLMCFPKPACKDSSQIAYIVKKLIGHKKLSGLHSPSQNSLADVQNSRRKIYPHYAYLKSNRSSSPKD